MFNVQRYGLQHVTEVRQGSWFEPLKDVEGQLVGIVSNPPYIPSDNISGLQAEVGRHEPRLALDGGASGIDYLLHLCNGAAAMLKPGGFFAFETNGEKQCKFLVDYMQNDIAGSFCNLNIVSDFAGIQRFVTGFRQ
jgi:release factor glutamine methyltransferase